MSSRYLFVTPMAMKSRLVLSLLAVMLGAAPGVSRAANLEQVADQSQESQISAQEDQNYDYVEENVPGSADPKPEKNPAAKSSAKGKPAAKPSAPAEESAAPEAPRPNPAGSDSVMDDQL